MLSGKWRPFCLGPSVLTCFEIFIINNVVNMMTFHITHRDFSMFICYNFGICMDLKFCENNMLNGNILFLIIHKMCENQTCRMKGIATYTCIF